MSGWVQSSTIWIRKKRWKVNCWIRKERWKVNLWALLTYEGVWICPVDKESQAEALAQSSGRLRRCFRYQAGPVFPLMDESSGSTSFTAQLVGADQREGQMHWAEIHGHLAKIFRFYFVSLSWIFVALSFGWLSCYLDIF